MTIEQFKEYLKTKGVDPNKTYGQHFLMSDIVLEDTVDAAEVTSEDVVVEVGPGIGNLTERILSRGAQVIAIEKDEQFRYVLNRLKKQYKNLTVIYGDVLKTELSSYVKNKKYKVVANIPYYITGKIIQYFLRGQVRPTSLTLLVQKEVALNVVAKPGRLGLLGLSVQMMGEGKLIRDVAREEFFPQPKVTSAVIRIDLSEKINLSDEEERKFFKLLRAAFLGKRKQLHNVLKSNLRLENDRVMSALEAVKILPNRRPQELSLEEWVKLFRELEKEI